MSVPEEAAAKPHDGVGLAHLVRVIGQRWTVVVLCVFVSAGVTLLLALRKPKEYAATASLLFRTEGVDQSLFGTNFFVPSVDPAREAATDVKLVSLGVVSQRTAAALQTNGLTASRIAAEVSVSADGQSNIVSVTATDRVPRLAATIANTFANQFIAFRRDADRAAIEQALSLVRRQIQANPAAASLQSRAEQLQILSSVQTGNVELVQPAGTPSSPSSPAPRRDAIVGGVLGLVLGVLLVLLLDRLDRRLKDPDQFEAAFGYPLLAAIPESDSLASGTQVSAGFGGVGETEAFSLLRGRLRYFNVDRDIRSVLVTSVSPGDGKTTVACNLAVAAAGTVNARVLLLEADLRRPSIAARFDGLEAKPGLAEFLTHGLALDEVAQRVRIDSGNVDQTPPHSLDVIVAGAIPPNPVELLESASMRNLLGLLVRDYEFIVIDTAPTSLVSDALPLLSQVSGVIVVGSIGTSTREGAAHLRDQLLKSQAPVLGVVANRYRDRSAGYYGYRYGYAPSTVPSWDGEGSAESADEARDSSVVPPFN